MGMNWMGFEDELRACLNRNNLDTYLDMEDYRIAEYILESLRALKKAREGLAVKKVDGGYWGPG